MPVTRSANRMGIPASKGDSVGNSEQETNDVGALLASVRQMTVENEQELTSETQGDRDQKLRNSLNMQADTQRRLVSVGKIVGERGTAEQIVQDAKLAHHVNRQTIPVIKGIKINGTLWNARDFQKKLMFQLHTLSDTSADDHAESLGMRDKEYCRQFVTEYSSAVCPGYTPILATVYGAKAPLVNGDCQKRPRTQKDKDVDTKQRITVQKATDRHLSVAVDQTTLRVNELYDAVVEAFQETQLPLCLMTFLVDRDSYEATVQNFFCFGFLVKDGRVRLWLDESKLPVCAPTQVPTQELSARVGTLTLRSVPHPQPELAQDDAGSFTVIMNLTEEKWKELVKSFKL